MSQYSKITASNSILYNNNLALALNSGLESNNNLLTNRISSALSIENSISTTTLNKKNNSLNIERNLSSSLYTKNSIAISKEYILSNSISTELSRATSYEIMLSNNISLETQRASTSETQIINKITNMIGTAPSNLDTIGEIAIALSNEPNIINIINSQISNEVSRAVSYEVILSNTLSNETIRTDSIQQNLSNIIQTESTRAINAENNLSSAITIQNTNATNAETSINNYRLSVQTSISNNLSSILSTESNRAIVSERALSSSLSIISNNTANIQNSVTFTSIPTLNYTPPEINTTTTTIFGSIKKILIYSIPTDGTNFNLGTINIPPGVWFLEAKINVRAGNNSNPILQDFLFVFNNSNTINNTAVSSGLVTSSSNDLNYSGLNNDNILTNNIFGVYANNSTSTSILYLNLVANIGQGTFSSGGGTIRATKIA